VGLIATVIVIVIKKEADFQEDYAGDLYGVQEVL
jgi:hypothetical protein